MTQAYVRFGKVENPKFTRVYEGIARNGEIQIIIPKISHGGARDILSELGFGDVEIFMVTGTPVETDERDRLYLKDTRIIQKLEYDSNQEKIMIPKAKSPIASFAKTHSKKEEMK